MSDKRTLMEHIFCTRRFAKCQMPSVFYKEDVFWKQCGMFYRCSGKRTASSSVSVTGSKVREDFTNEMTFDLEEERYSEALCQCPLNMSEGWVTASRLGWWQHGVHGGSAVGDEVKLCDATVEERKCSSPAGTGLKALRGRFSAYTTERGGDGKDEEGPKCLPERQNSQGEREVGKTMNSVWIMLVWDACRIFMQIQSEMEMRI